MLSLRLVIREMAEKSLSSSLFQKVRDITLQLNVRGYHSPSIYQILIVLGPNEIGLEKLIIK